MPSGYPPLGGRAGEPTASEPAPASSPPRAPGRRRRRLRAALLVLGAYTLLCFAYSLVPDRVPKPTLTRLTTFEVQNSPIQAGTGWADIAPPETLWSDLNVFGERRPIKGVAQPMRARALALTDGEGRRRLLIVSCELTFVTRELRLAALDGLAEAGCGNTELLLVATHTHTAPGNYWRGKVGAFVCGRFSQAYFDYLVTGIVAAGRGALGAVEPVVVSAGSAETSGLTRHLVREDRGTGNRYFCDDSVQALALRRKDGSLLAALVSFAAHPLTLRHLTAGRVAGDYPGDLSRLIEAGNPGAVALFLPGALGGVRATTPVSGEGRLSPPGRFDRVAMQAHALLEAITPVLQQKGQPLERLAVATALVPLPAADPHFFPEATPFGGVRFLTGPVSWLSNRLLDGLFLPDDAIFQVVEIGDTTLLGVPADLSNAIGIKLKSWVDSTYVWPLSHANGYDLGYVLDEDEYDLSGVTRGGYDRLMDICGKPAGPFTIRTLFALAGRIRVGQTATSKRLVP